MKFFNMFYGAFALLFMVAGGGAAVLAATPAIEGTPIPPRPKPDLSSMKFLIGTWQCSDLSSRRPGPFTVTEVFSMDPTGFWVVRDDTTHTTSWVPNEFHSQTKYTYDPLAKQWVRITYGGRGGYAVATAPMPGGNKKIYTYLIQRTAPDILSYAPEVYTKVSDTKKTMTTSFTETNGRIVTVKETCNKS